MKKIKELEDISVLLKKRVHFTSDCETFPINLIGKVLSIKDAPNKEKLMQVRVIENNKVITIGSNMHNLKFEIVKN